MINTYGSSRMRQEDTKRKKYYSKEIVVAKFPNLEK
jgi:hypothetical protein